jgi:hypothetical protein
MVNAFMLIPPKEIWRTFFRKDSIMTCPPKTGPDFVIVFWDNLGHE